MKNVFSWALACAVLAAPGMARSDTDQASDESSTVAVEFVTTEGAFELQLFPESAPITVRNFLEYVDQGFYDHTVFHRVIPQFIIQGGGLDPQLNEKPTLTPIENESNNGLKNIGGSVAMARTDDPNSAAAQFFINLRHNPSLDANADGPGYTVFGKVSQGMDIIRNISRLPTTTVGALENVPEQPVVITAARRTGVDRVAEDFVEGEDYVVLKKAAATRNPDRIEVVEAFSYGCPYCYQLEAHVRVWEQAQDDDVDFHRFHAAWNESMRLYAQAFFTALELGILEQIHVPLFNALQAQQRQLTSPRKLAEFFAEHGVEQARFIEVFRSAEVQQHLDAAGERVAEYELSGVPQFIVNGKYRVDPVRADGRKEMLDVVDYLIDKERELLKSSGSAGGR